MNFLAHLHLAERCAGTSGALTGAVLGDFVKGPVQDDLPGDISLGVRLHRRIDAVSNTLPGVRDSARRFPRNLRRYAPPLIDVLADHFLTLAWERHESIPLPEFTARAYRHLAQSMDLFPEPGARFVRYAADCDLFASYADWRVVERAIGSIARRLRINHELPTLNATIEQELPALHADFDAYYPDLQHRIHAWVRDHAPEG